jgi:ribosome maturation factor RimP
LLPFASIGSARLVLNDALIREALRRDKAARQQAKKARRGKSPDIEQDSRRLAKPASEHRR